MGILLAIAAAVLPTTTLVLEGSLREEIRAGTSLALNGQPNAIGIEEVLTPNVGGSWTDQENQLTLRYDPELLIPDFTQGNHLQVLHRGRLEDILTARSGTPTLSLSEDVQYGIIDLFGLTPTASSPNPTALQNALPPSLQPFPSVTGIAYIYSDTLASVRQAISPRLNLDVGGGYLLAGGADAAAQTSFPLEKGPFGSAALTYRLSRRDTSTTRLAVNDLQFSSGPRDLLTELTQQIDRRLSRHLSGSLALGGALVRFQPQPNVAGAYSVYPEASAYLTESRTLDRWRSLSAGLSLAVSPLIDRLTGDVFENLQLLGRLTWAAERGWSLGALGGIGDPLYGNLTSAPRVEIVQGTVSYEPYRFLRLAAGGIGTWQQLGGAGGVGLPGFQWLTFAAVVLQETLQK